MKSVYRTLLALVAFVFLVLFVVFIQKGSRDVEPKVSAERILTSGTQPANTLHKTTKVGPPADQQAKDSDKDNRIDTDAFSYDEQFLARAELLDERIGQPDKEGIYEVERLVQHPDFKVPYLRVVEQVNGNVAEHRVLSRKVHAADRILVQLDENLSDEQITTLAGSLGCEVEEALKMQGCFVFKTTGQVDLDTVTELIKAADMDELAQATILHSEPEFVYFALGMPSDPLFDNQWGLHNIGQAGGLSDADIDAPAAWDLSAAAGAVPVAVIDTGVDRNHPDLASNIWSNPDEVINGIDDDGNGYVDDIWGWDFYSNDNNPDDATDHGTHCAGIIGAAGDNAIGIAGTAWTARIASIRFMSSEGAGLLSDAINAITYANNNGFSISSNSWGGEGYSTLLYQAIRGIQSVDALFISAAGNESVNIDSYPVYPAAYNLSGIISVAATDRFDRLAHFSNYGVDNVDLAAPGVDIYSTLPGGNYGYMDGTSMAAPFVAGAAALLRDLRQDLDAGEVKAALLGSTDSLSSLNGKIGHGRLNLAALLLGNAGAFPQVKNVRISDSTQDGGVGNGDTIPSPGETLALFVEVENIGSEALGHVTLTAEPVSPTSEITFVQGTNEYWNILPGSTATGNNPLKVYLSSSIATPKQFQIRILIQDDKGKSWVTNYPINVYSLYTVQGTVIDEASGLPVADAEILDVADGSVLGRTNAAGNYSLSLVDGAYALQVLAQGYLPSDTIDLSFPPGIASPINFKLGRSEMNISPASIVADVNGGQSSQRTITVSNSGNRPLEFSIQKVYKTDAGTAASTIGESSSISFVDGFEEGSLANWVLGSNGVDVELTAETKVEGATSLYMKSSFYNTHFVGLHHDLQEDAKPANIKFSIRSGSVNTDDSYFVLRDRSSQSESIRFHAAADGTFKLNSDQFTYPYEAKRWYTIEFRDIDWVSGHLDFLVDDVVVAMDVPFHQQIAGQGGDRIFLYNYTQDSISWWDNLIVGEGSESWISLYPQSATVQPNGSLDIDVVLTAGGLINGSYYADLVFYSNVPGQSETIVPVTMNILEIPNTAPVVQSFALNISEDEQIQFPLRASDADGNKVTARIDIIPSVGALYQVLSDGSIGPRIVADGTFVMNRDLELVFIPPSHGHGVPMTSFTYSVSDGKDQSGIATVTINVTEVNDIPIARDDYYNTANGESIPSIPVLSNDTDADGDILQLVSIGTPGQGTATDNGDGTISYVPDPEFLDGIDSFTYTISDGRGGTSQANVIIRNGSSAGGDWPTLGANVQHTGNYPAALGTGSFKEVWSIPDDILMEQSVVVENRVFTTLREPDGYVHVRARDVSTGSLIWEYSFPGMEPPHDINPPAYYNGRLYVVRYIYDRQGQLWCFDASTGEVIWQTTHISGSNEYLSPTVDDRGIFINGGSYGGMYRFNHDGSEAFFFEDASNDYLWAPAIDHDGFVYSWSGGFLRQHDPDTGVENWNLQLGNSTTPVIWDNYLVGHDASNLYVINLTTHQVAWQLAGAFGGLPAVSNGILYIYSREPQYYKIVVEAYAIDTGAHIRTYSTANAGNPYENFQPIVTQDVLIASLYRATQILDLTTGEVRQQLPYGGRTSLGSGNLVIQTSYESIGNYANPASLVVYRFARDNEELPAADSLQFRGTEDTQLVMQLTGSDASGLPVAPVLTSLPYRGALYQTSDGVTAGNQIVTVPVFVEDKSGRLIYVPERDGFGENFDRFEFVVSNGFTASESSGTATIHLDPLPDSPVAVDDLLFTMPGHEFSRIDALQNDYDVDGDTLHVQSFNAAVYGTLTLNADGTFRYVPSTGITQGNEKIRYTVADGTGLTASATMEIRVEQQSGVDWPTYGGNTRHDGFLKIEIQPTGWTRAWSVDFPSYGNSPAIADGKVFASSYLNDERGYVAAYDLLTGGQLWTYDFPGYQIANAINPPTFHEDKIYLQRSNSSSDSQVWCLSADMGEPIWNSPFSCQWDGFKPPVVTDGRVLINGGYGGGMYGYNAETGKQLFFHALPSGGGWAPAYANGIVYEVVRGKFQAHHPDTGEVLWSLNLDRTKEFDFGSQVVLKGNRAIIGTDNGLYCVSLDRRIVLWHAGDYYYHAGHFPAVADDRVYIGEDSRILEYSLYTGELLGEFITGSSNSVGQYIVTKNLLIASSNYNTYIFDRQTGVLEQVLDEGGQIALGRTHLVICSGIANTLTAYTVPAGVVPENTIPTAYDAEVNINEDSQVVMQLEGIDPDGDRLVTVVSSLPDRGTLYQTIDGITPSGKITHAPISVKNSDSKVIFVPYADENGSPYTSFTFRVQDGMSVSEYGTAVINVAPVNDPPIAVSDYHTIRPSQDTFFITPGINDIDLDGDALKVVGFTQPAIGRVERVDDFTLRYYRDTNLASCETEFSYTIEDAAGKTSSAYVYLVVDTETGTDWPAFGANMQHTQYQPVDIGSSGWLTGINIDVGDDAYQLCVADGVAYVSSGETGYYPDVSMFHVEAFDLSNGQSLWKYSQEVEHSFNPNNGILYYDGRLYVQTSEHSSTELLCIDALDGTLLWASPAAEQWSHHIAPVADETGVYIHSGYYGGMRGYTLDGTPKFDVSLASVDFWAPTIDKAGKLYTWLSRFSEHDKVTGEKIWEYNPDDSGSYTYLAAAVIVDETAFLQGSNKLIAFDLVSKEPVWELETYCNINPAVANDRVYQVVQTAPDSRKYHLVSVDPDTGRILNRIVLETSQIYTPPVLTNDAVIVCNDSQTWIYDRFSGYLWHTLPVGGSVVVANDMLCFSSNRKIITYGRPDKDNHPPVVQTIQASGPEDTVIPVQLLGYDADDDPITFHVVSLPENGSLFQTVDGSTPHTEILEAPTVVSHPQAKLVFVPDDNGNGTGYGNFTYLARDAFTESPVTDVQIDVEPVDDTPVGIPDVFLAARGATVSPLSLLANDYDVDGDVLSVFSYTQPTYCTVLKSDTGELSLFVPADVEVSQDFFTYYLTDSVGPAVPVLVTIQIVRESNQYWTGYGGGPGHTGFVFTDNGKLEWIKTWTSPDLGYNIQALAVADGKVFAVPDVTNQATPLRALNQTNGSILWTQQLGTTIRVNSPAWHDGRLYIQVAKSGDYTLRCLDAGNGSEIWRAPYEDQTGFHLAPAVTDNGVWINAGASGGIYGFDLDGNQRFFTELEQYDQWTPTVAADGKVYSYVGGSFACHDPVNGQVLWSLNLGWEWHGWSMNTVPVVSGNLAFVIGSPATHCIDLDKGEIKWSVVGRFSGAPAISGDIVFLSYFNIVQAYRVHDGQLVGEYANSDWQPFNVQPLVTNNRIFASDGNKTVVFDRQTTELIQVLPEGGRLAMVDNALFIATYRKIVRYDVKKEVSFTPPPGMFEKGVNIRVVTADPATTVYYTINGANPVVGGRRLEFEEMFYIDKSAVVRAIGVNPDQTTSEVFEFEYIIRDDDQDGLPDWWELKHFNGIESQSANSDFDLDGQTEMQEFLFHTYPNSAESFYALDPPVPGDGPRILNWQALPNRCYTVLGSKDLLTWQVLFENLSSIEGVIETVVTDPELKFFHIRVRH